MCIDEEGIYTLNYPHRCREVAEVMYRHYTQRLQCGHRVSVRWIDPWNTRYRGGATADHVVHPRR